MPHRRVHGPPAGLSGPVQPKPSHALHIQRRPTRRAAARGRAFTAIGVRSPGDRQHEASTRAPRAGARRVAGGRRGALSIRSGSAKLVLRDPAHGGWRTQALGRRPGSGSPASGIPAAHRRRGRRLAPGHETRPASSSRPGWPCRRCPRRAGACAAAPLAYRDARPYAHARARGPAAAGRSNAVARDDAARPPSDIRHGRTATGRAVCPAPHCRSALSAAVARVHSPSHRQRARRWIGHPSPGQAGGDGASAHPARTGTRRRVGQTCP